MNNLAALAPLLDAMLALPVAGRAAWIESLGAEHEPLKPHLRGLLDASFLGDATHAFDDDALWQAWPDEARRVIEERLAADLRPGAQVGPYRLIRPLGEGGMGTVWLAGRADGTLKRELALKLPASGPQRLKLGERFARERDILAALVHPHIARLYDAGVAEDGQPYLAMEAIAGVPITAYAGQRGLDPRARVRLFLQVLGAVQHAHNQLVVHRDLKPSNILVDAEGQVHLLDFGIATLLDRPAGDAALTDVGQAPLTPAYASPEQVAGRPLGTASDVYSLGVVLCELLCGARPYRLPRDTRAALEEAILAQEPMLPSRAPGLAPATARALRGDLDNIVLKALNKSATERYASADAFAADLQRFLDHQPVQAYRAPWRVRLRKFEARHRLPLWATAMVVLAVVAGVTGTVLQRQQAQHEARRALAVKQFLVKLFEQARTAPSGAGIAAREASVNDLLQAGTTLVETSFAHQPDIRDEVYETLIDLLSYDTDRRRTLALAQRRLAAAQQAFGADDLRSAPAEVALAALLVNESEVEPARRHLAHAEQVFERAHDDRSLNYARLLRWQGEFEWMRAHLPGSAAPQGWAGHPIRRAVALLRERYPDEDDLFEALTTLAFLACDAGEPVQALAAADELHQRAVARHGAASLFAVHADNARAGFLYKSGRAADAVPVFERARGEYLRLFGQAHQSVSIATRGLALALLAAGRTDEGRRELEALRERVRRFGADDAMLQEMAARLDADVAAAQAGPVAGCRKPAPGS